MSNILFGVVCLDIYTNTGFIRPGCGILHNAYHLQRLGCEPLLITRLGQTQADPFLRFFAANDIATLPAALIAEGDSASIEIELQENGEALISNFSLGVWQTFRLTPAEAAILAQAAHVHTVLVEGIIDQFTAWLERGLFKQALISADCLSFRNFTVDRFAHLLAYLDVAFVGWKGSRSDPTLAAIRRVARQQKAVVVITFGARGIEVLDGRGSGCQAQFFAVEPVPVTGNTNGCGDAFIAYFLAEYWRSRDLEKAVASGKVGGALATQWAYGLPETAYSKEFMEF